MSAETERIAAIRQALALGHYDNLRGVSSCRATVEALLAALDTAQARSTALQTALAQASSHHAGCPVPVLADSYREE